MKASHVLSLSALCHLSLLAAPPPVTDHVYGGSGEEDLRDIAPLPGGGLVLGGSLSGVSTNGNRIATSHGDRDFWLIRPAAGLQPVWDRAYGGSGPDEFRRVLALRDGGFLLIGGSASEPGGTKTAAREGDFDGWIVRVAADGTPLWDRAYGGLGGDRLDHGVELSDGGFLLVGTSSSEPGPAKSAPLFGASDAWVVRADGYAVRLADDEGRLTAPSQTTGQMSEQGFRLTLTGLTNLWYRIERSPDLVRWGTLSTERGADTPVFLTDPEATNVLRRFYRARLIASP